jgi:hypothetical protein
MMMMILVSREPVKTWSGDGCVTQVGGWWKEIAGKGCAGIFDGKEALG